MLIQDVLIFLNKIEPFSESAECDAMFYKTLFSHFRDKDAESQLDHENMICILNAYGERWRAVVGSDLDYSLNCEGINGLLIEFAKESAPFLNKKYYQILFSTAENTQDFNNAALLEDIANPSNYYFDSVRNVLYTKRGLCQRLSNNAYYLSIFRNDEKTILSTLTVDELTRLKYCNQTAGRFSIGSESFDNFWCFLNVKVFPQLKTKGRLSLVFLPELFNLIERYFYLKNKESDFSLFKSHSNVFFNLLDKAHIEKVNFLYGMKITHDCKELFLVELFIIINKADSYIPELDAVMSSLARWLSEFNPVLKINTSEPYSFGSDCSIDFSASASSSSCQASSSSYSMQFWAPSDPAFERAGSEIASELTPCLALILSLLISDFKHFSVSKKNITLWDVQNNVSERQFRIFQLLAPALTSDNLDDLRKSYEATLKVHIGPVSNNLSWLPGKEPLKNWCQYVSKNELNKFNVYWFEPELIFQGVFSFSKLYQHLITHQELSEHMKQLLDDIINTYAQRESELQKKIRVNVLFARWMSTINKYDETHNTHHARLLKIYFCLNKLAIAKANFLNNCSAYIASRLAKEQPGFHGTVRMADGTRISSSSSEESMLVADIIKRYKSGLFSLKIDLTNNTALVYLMKLSKPILSCSELDEAKRSTYSSDYYLGAPS